MSDDPTLELVVFQKKPEVDENDFLEAAKSIDGFLQRVGGFIRRELWITGEGRFVDTVWWDSLPAALHAADEILEDPATRRFIGMIDRSRNTMAHARRVHVREGGGR